MASATNNSIGKPWLILVARPNTDDDLIRKNFREGRCGIMGGFDSREEAEAALQEYFDARKDDLPETFRATVVHDPKTDDDPAFGDDSRG